MSVEPYFTEARDISNRQTLLNVVAKSGLDRSKAEAVLKSDNGTEAIKEAGELSQRLSEKKRPIFRCHGHGLAWPCCCRSEDTAMQSHDRGTQETLMGLVIDWSSFSLRLRVG